MLARETIQKSIVLKAWSSDVLGSGSREKTPPPRPSPPALTSGEFSRDPDPSMTLDYAFKTMLFWIVSRVNNCHY